jgi:holo-ACP synthase/triphosphoribosyl-dephospho-CoA synthase
LNIPGYPKTNEMITGFFNQICEEIFIFLEAYRILFKIHEKIVDEAGNFMILDITTDNFSVIQIKEITESFEENHSLGRIIDLDVTDKNCANVSSGKAKKCFVCNSSAIICMKEQRHDYNELRNLIFDKITNYISSIRREKIIRNISEIALKSLLYEVSLSPKPGLVDFNNSGSHSDMNFFTFLNSTASLSNYFTKFAEKGYDFSESYSKALPVIRNIGLQMEGAMFKATNNINTQKGLIFLLGLSVFTSANLLSGTEKFSIRKFREIIMKICKNLTENELVYNIQSSTHGEITFQKYGTKAGGARLEAELGFPTVFNFGLPVLEMFLKKLHLNDKETITFALQKTLISIISNNNDTNILFRKGEKVLENLKILAHKTFNDELKYSELVKFCKKENISPGGSADLLVISVFVFFIVNQD